MVDPSFFMFFDALYEKITLEWLDSSKNDDFSIFCSFSSLFPTTQVRENTRHLPPDHGNATIFSKNLPN